MKTKVINPGGNKILLTLKNNMENRNESVCKKTFGIIPYRVLSLFLLLMLCNGAMAMTPWLQITNDQFNIQVSQVSIKTVFDQIEAESDYVFFYEADLDLGQKVDINIKRKNIRQTLDMVLRNTDLTYVISGKEIYVKKKEKTSAPTTAQQQKKFRVQGVVTSPTGEPLIGVNIQIEGEKGGSITDVNGTYAIWVPNEEATLIFSYIGYVPEEKAVRGQNVINVMLSEDAALLDEVVVVGYGTQKKANLSGAVETVTAQELSSRATNNVGLALQGLVPNLNISMSSGGADYTPTFNIRGETSINGSNEPLILVDGVPTSSADFSRMNAMDIENISVLKDASSAAIYGARAAFGVILVTTKKGQKGSIKVNFNNSFNVHTPTRIVQVVEDPYIQAYYKTIMGAPWYHLYTDDEIAYAQQRVEDPSLPNAIPSTTNQGQYTYLDAHNYYDEIFENVAFAHQHSLSLSGGSDKVNYYLGMDYYGENGLLRYNKDKFKRYNVRSKIEFHPWEWLSIGNNTNWSYYTYNRPTNFSSSLFKEVYEKNCMYPVYNPDGTFTVVGAQTVGRLQYGGDHVDKSSNFSTQFTAQIDLFKDIWSLKGDFTVNLSNGYGNEWNSDDEYTYKRGPELDYEHVGDQNYAMRTNSNTIYTVLNLYTDFHKQWGDHSLSAIIGFNQEYKSYEYLKSKRNGLISESYPTLQLATGEMTMEEDAYQWAIRSGFYRLNYMFKDRYIVETNGRYDGTSRFPKKDRFGFFPSVSGAWILSEEPFFRPLKKVFNHIKLRASYGSLGNQNVDYYSYIAAMTSAQSGVLLNGELPMTVSPAGLVSNSLTWEKVYTINGGIDINMLNNRLIMSADVYRRNTKDMLVPGHTLPSVLGTSVPKANNGDMKTRGWEFSVTWRDHFNLASKPFNYSATFVLSDSRSWITRYDNPTNLLSDYRVGQEIGEIWGLVTEGFFKDQADIDSHADQWDVTSYPGDRPIEPGDLKYKDLNGDGKINRGAGTVDDPGDFTIIGNDRSRFPFGLDLNADWNGFDLRVFVQGVAKKDWYPTGYKFFGIFVSPWGNVLENNLDHWTEDNPNGYFPRLKSYTATGGDMYIEQTRYLQNAAYLRMKNITLGYTLPRQLVSKWGLSSIRFYFSGENLFEITKLCKNYDPEGLNDNMHPFQRTFSIGLNIAL